MWTNNAGDIFFAGTDKASAGTFWEMPNITPMGDGKWLFTTTPQNTGAGVRTLYWTGTINADGTFSPDASSASPRGVELISKNGYGLLSPTIYQHEGKTIALGIVPDKLPSSINYSLGWAHCYSLPREWSVDSRGNLLQRPYEGLRQARSKGVTRAGFELSGSETIDEVKGRQVELLGRFTVGSSPFGFRFFKDGGSAAVLKYIPSANMISIDLTGLDRTPNDNGTYNGLYTCVLPETVPAWSELKINLFIDGSVLDLFINDKWATSMRVFPSSANADGVEVFADSSVNVVELGAWELDGTASGIDDIVWGEGKANVGPVDVYDVQGRYLKTASDAATAREGLSPGLYVIGGRKEMVR